jgi:hypothetical protein
MFGQEFIQISHYIINVDHITRIDRATDDYNGFLYTSDGSRISLTLDQYQKIYDSLRGALRTLDVENVDTSSSDNAGSSRFPWENL